MITKIFSFINITTLIIFLSGCEVPSNGEEESYREDGTLKSTVTFEDGIVSKSENFREDGTLEVIVTLEDGVVSKSETVVTVDVVQIYCWDKNLVVTDGNVFECDEVNL